MRTLLLCLFLPLTTSAQNALSEIIAVNRDSFSTWVTDPARYEIQVLYTQIDRPTDSTVTLTTHRWGGDGSQYFYPASTVKLPVAALALQRLNQLGVEGLDAQTLLFHGTGTAPAASPQTPARRDTSSRSGYPSVAHYVRKILLDSDNDAYNRLFEWLGPTYINEALAAIGIDDTRIIHRVGVLGFDVEAHRWLNPVKFVDGTQVPYQIGERRDNFHRAMPQVQGQVKGAGYTTADGTLVNEPFDFRHKNYLSLNALHGILARIVLPEAFPADEQFKLTVADRELLLTAMRQRPRESDYPRYDLPDNHVKFWVYGDQSDSVRIPANLRLLNKVGWAYGYLTDAAYIIDEATGVEFLLVGTIHVNDNQIYNDGVYEYDEVGLPFFGELGRAVLRYEQARVKR